MTDRELLELAAKAAGIGPVGDLLGGGHYIACKSAQLGMWAPLTYDSDALRLAVKLKMDLHFEWNGPMLGDIVEVFHRHMPDEGSCSCVTAQTNKDPCAATRRAIVQAAAEIGKNL